MTLALTKRDKVLLIILAVIIVILLYFKVLISPTLQIISSTKTEIQNNTDKLSGLENKKSQNVLLKKNIEKLKVKYNDEKNSIAEGTKDGNITISLQELCSKNKLKLSNVNYVQGVEYSGNTNSAASAQKNINVAVGTIMKMETTIIVNGSLKDINNFVADLEHTDRLNLISNIAISKTSDVYNATINTSYFYVLSEKNQ